jgi:uncharacterized membrane protein
MSRKWLEREAPRWIREEIITTEQYERIVQLYPREKRTLGLLTIFGGLFIGIGIISFIAANWQELPELFRILLLATAMVAAYLSGERILASGRTNLGIAVIGIGLFLFGGSIILIGQMYHMIAFSALSIIIWAVAGLALTFLYRSRYLGAISLILFTVAQIYSLQSFNAFSFAAYAILIVGFWTYLYLQKDRAISALWSLSVVIHSLILVISQEWSFGWFIFILALLHSLTDLHTERSQRVFLQLAPLAAGFIFSVVQVFMDGEWRADLLPNPEWFLTFFVLLLLGNAYMKWRDNRVVTMLDWLLFLPLFYFPDYSLSILYLVTIFIFSLYVLLRGYTAESREQIYAGTVLFLISTMVAYFKLTWDFMDKSLFFIIGGILLFLLSWLLNLRTRQILRNKGGNV